MLSQDDPALIVKRANALLHATTTSDKYITFFLAILDINENNITYCNAGHDNPIHIKNSKCEQLLPCGIPLGFLSDFDFSPATPVKIMDINAGHAGDVNGYFQDYSYEANRDLIGRSYRKTGFLSRIPDERLDAVARLPETFECPG